MMPCDELGLLCRVSFSFFQLDICSHTRPSARRSVMTSVCFYGNNIAKPHRPFCVSYAILQQSRLRTALGVGKASLLCGIQWLQRSQV